ncbi:hypothetical protein CW746_03505 [Staphylococcus succinus]|nr:hypothetical protein CW746_03505 [Staphylococcus succinus]
MKKLIYNAVLLILFIRSIFVIVEWANGNSDAPSIVIFIYFLILCVVLVIFIHYVIKKFINNSKNT